MDVCSVKILCISDRIEPRVYSTSIKTRYKDIDLVIGAGDLPLSYYDFIVSNLNKPLLFVFGNHQLKALSYYRTKRPMDYYTNTGEPYQRFNVGATYIDRKAARTGGLLIAGLGGCLWYNGGENQLTNRRMALRIMRILPALLWNRIFHGRYLDVLVTHAAPYGVGDKDDPCHRGFKAFLWFMRCFKPRYLIHGHIHLFDINDPREKKYHETIVINAFRQYILEIDDNGLQKRGGERFPQGTA